MVRDRDPFINRQFVNITLIHLTKSTVKSNPLFKGKAKLFPNCKKFCILGGMEMIDRFTNQPFLCKVNEGKGISGRKGLGSICISLTVLTLDSVRWGTTTT